MWCYRNEGVPPFFNPIPPQEPFKVQVLQAQEELSKPGPSWPPQVPLLADKLKRNPTWMLVYDIDAKNI